MKKAIPFRIVLVALLALVISAFAPSAHAVTDPYLRIAEGDSRARVIGLLGEPVDPRDLTVAERKSIQEALRITDHKDAVDFVVWRQSSHLFYLIGFNKRGVVATKHRVIGLLGAS